MESVVMVFNRLLKGIFERCKELIIHPADEWGKIDEENSSMNQLFRDFLIPILLISALASVVGEMLDRFSVGLDGGELLAEGLREFFGFLISVYISIYLVDELIKIFGGGKNITKTSALIVYSSVPSVAVSFVIGLFPSLYAIGVFGLYSFYLFYLGAPVLYKIPEHRLTGFIVSAILLVSLVFTIINYLLFKVLFILS
jgi:hypothetical protein